MAWPNGYTWRATLTLPHTTVVADVTDGVVTRTCVFGTGKFTSASGFDCIVTSDANGATRLDHQIIAFDAASGTITLRVRVPTYSATVDPALYVFVGNSSVTTSQETTAVWDASTAAAWDLEDDPGAISAPQMKDATSNARHLTTSGMVSGDRVTGQVGQGASFSGGTKTASNASGLGLPGGSTAMATLCGWVKLSGTSMRGAFLKAGDTSSGYGIGVGSGDFDTLGNDLLGLYELTRWVVPAVSLGTGWHHVALIINNGGATMVLDGAQVSTDSGTGPIAPGTSSALGGYSTRVITGGTAILDEWIACTTARSLDWIKIIYASQNTPTTFGTLGSLQTSAVDMPFDLAHSPQWRALIAQ